ncbi:hypothetical protein QBC39DRAFT_83054 [Podospora conica]|nr:hypothetical protein QBC39DRAFT_83054 [Schizothecium conicum]
MGDRGGRCTSMWRRRCPQIWGLKRHPGSWRDWRDVLINSIFPIPVSKWRSRRECRAALGKIFLRGRGVATSEHMTKARPDRMKPQSDSTTSRHTTKKMGWAAASRAVLPLRSCWSFRAMDSQSAAGSSCVPIADCPAMVEWPWQSGGGVGWSVDQHAASCPSGGITKPPWPGDGTLFVSGVVMGLRWKQLCLCSCHRRVGFLDCPSGRLPRRCDVQGLEDLGSYRGIAIAMLVVDCSASPGRSRLKGVPFLGREEITKRGLENNTR